MTVDTNFMREVFNQDMKKQPVAAVRFLEGGFTCPEKAEKGGGGFHRHFLGHETGVPAC